MFNILLICFTMSLVVECKKFNLPKILLFLSLSIKIKIRIISFQDKFITNIVQ